MAQASANQLDNELYHEYTQDGELFPDNISNYNDQFKQTGYTSLLSNFTDSVLNVSLRTFNDEFDYITAGDSNETDNFFPLAILLEESWWNVFNEKYLRHSWEWTLTLISSYMLIFIVGVIGNCMVILVVSLRPQMKTVTNMFIMNLAVADLFVIVFCVGPTLLANIFLPWILGSFMCKGVAYIQGVSVCASAYNLVAISLDRCYAVYRPLARYRGLSKSQALKILSLTWVIALFLTLPWAVIFNIVISENDGLVHCQETWEDEYHGNLYYLIVNLSFCYGLPLVIISVANAVVWCHISNRNVPQESASAAIIVKRVHQRARENVRKMLSIVTLTFLISWLPLYVLVTRLKFATDMSESEHNLIDMMMPFAQWLGSSNSCINPILYAFLNKKFRDEFHSLLPAWIRVFYVSKMMGVGTQGYSVNASIPALSITYRPQGSRPGQQQNSDRIHTKHHNTSTMRVSSFCEGTETICITGLPGSVMDKKQEFMVDATNSIVNSKGTSGVITDL